MNPYTEPDLLSQTEVAHRLGVSRTTVWRLVRSGDLQLIHIGRRALVPRSAVERFIEDGADSRAR
jgi:excisionase family DNA binding protein